MSALQQRVQEVGTGNRGGFAQQWKAFDRGWMKPMFGGRRQQGGETSVFSSPSRDGAPHMFQGLIVWPVHMSGDAADAAVLVL